MCLIIKGQLEATFTSGLATAWQCTRREGLARINLKKRGVAGRCVQTGATSGLEIRVMTRKVHARGCPLPRGRASEERKTLPPY